MKKMQIRLTAAAAAVMIAVGAAAPAAVAQTGMAPAGQEAHAAAAARKIDEDEYLLPGSDAYYITEGDISWMDDNELMLARNEFYARRGRKFVTRSIRDYFNSRSWYRGRIEPDDFSTDLFNRYEQANVDFIVSYENRRKEIREQRQEKARSGVKAGISMTGGSGDSPAEESLTRNAEEFAEIMDLYPDTVRQDWSEEDYAQAGMCTMLADLQKPEDLGYLYRDLDEDGSAELVIAPMDPRMYGEGAVYGIYTIEDNIPVKVAESAENVCYYLCSDNTIRREEILDDGRWVIGYYDLAGQDLVCKDILVMDETRNENDPWFVVDDVEELDDGREGYADAGALRDLPAEAYTSISYEEASRMRTAYAADVLDLTAFD